MIYGLIEWRRVGNWRKCIQDCVRAKRASRFLKYISALKTYNSSQISIYTLLINHCLSVQYVHDCVRNTRDMVLFIILTRTQETWEKWYRASGESEPKFVYFCVGKMFYIPTRNSRKSYYKWLRAIQLCVCVWNMRFFSYGWGPGAALGPLAGCRGQSPRKLSNFQQIRAFKMVVRSDRNCNFSSCNFAYRALVGGRGCGSHQIFRSSW